PRLRRRPRDRPGLPGGLLLLLLLAHGPADRDPPPVRTTGRAGRRPEGDPGRTPALGRGGAAQRRRRRRGGGSSSREPARYAWASDASRSAGFPDMIVRP